MTEEKAIRLCLKHRDARGFEFLVRQFRREAYYHAHAFLGNESDAADACQESFACAFAAMPRLRKLERFYPWFYRILKNRCLNMLDRRKTREAHADSERARERESPQTHAISSTPSSLLEAREEKDRIWRLLGKLQRNHREILTLKYIHGFRYDEITATLGIPRGTVMSRLYAARQAFRALYEAESTDTPAAAKPKPTNTDGPRP